MRSTLCLSLQIHWNIDSGSCSKVHPEAYGITVNVGNRFLGDKLVIFYTFGRLPYCNRRQRLMGVTKKGYKCHTPVDGGVPQAANFTAHFAQMEADINERMPNVSFDGLAVVDYEAWVPVWELNTWYRVAYQQLSEELAKKNCSGCSQAEITRKAHKEFDEGAK
ncbi:Hyaluronidase [Aphelenchoides fujianensis]|nr:Hyaluronidase [Aphelenchoides fujianensis]